MPSSSSHVYLKFRALPKHGQSGGLEGGGWGMAVGIGMVLEHFRSQMLIFPAAGKLRAELRTRSALSWAFGAWRCLRQRKLQYWRMRARRVSRTSLRRIIREWRFIMEMRRAWIRHCLTRPPPAIAPLGQ